MIMKRTAFKIGISFLGIISCFLAACTSLSSAGGVSPNYSAGAMGGAAPQKIALLLPLQGSVAGSAQAIRNGFLAAYYTDKQNNANTPSVSVIDTSSDVRSAYQQAVAQGASVIVGPLTKPQVQQLASMGNLPVPTLALNTIDTNNAPNNLYFYGLSPRDEAAQAAQRAWQSGYRRALIMAPANAWGQGIANAFVQQWQSQGGQIADTLAYGSNQDLTLQMARFLHVSQIKSKKPTKDTPPPTGPIRRDDMDVIFVVASPQQGRLIKPLLKFYYAGSVPVYATSSIYSGTPSPRFDRDLDGVIFGDMPWVLLSPGQLPGNLGMIHNRIETTWPSSFKNDPKLYALGVDAYRLAFNLNRMPNNPGIPGATGKLYMGPQHIVLRGLTWAQIRGGVPQVIN